LVQVNPPLKFVQVPLNGISSFYHINCTVYFSVVCKLAVGAINPATQVVHTDPWETLVVTSLHLDTEPLTATLWL